MSKLANIALKVCGMRDSDNIAAVAKAINPEYMGFIFYKKSPRYVGPGFELKGLENVKKIGVFVNENPLELVKKMKLHQLDFAQLHGDESPEDVRSLAALGIGLIKAIPVADDIDFSLLKAYEPYVEYFLFDTRTKEYGGSGRSFNWKVLENYPLTTPYFLSGGLTPEKISSMDFSKFKGLTGLDVNSGFESEPGVKEVRKLKEIMEL